jgi:hypothetical protein
MAHMHGSAAGITLPGRPCQAAASLAVRQLFLFTFLRAFGGGGIRLAFIGEKESDLACILVEVIGALQRAELVRMEKDALKTRRHATISAESRQSSVLSTSVST